jgi:hypothetical protein
MVEEVVMPMKSLADPTLLLKSEKFKEVTFPMQYLVNPTLLLGGDASFDHVLRISIPVLYEQGIIPLSSSTLPPSPMMVSFDWNDFVDNGSSASILSCMKLKVVSAPRCIVTRD